jgi:hypothetical protein
VLGTGEAGTVVGGKYGEHIALPIATAMRSARVRVSMTTRGSKVRARPIGLAHDQDVVERPHERREKRSRRPLVSLY